jgi:hypothetical protein
MSRSSSLNSSVALTPVMIFSQLLRPALIGITFALFAICIPQTRAAVSQESRLAAIQGLVQSSKFSDAVDLLSQLPQVRQHAQQSRYDGQKVLSDVSVLDSVIRHSAFQHLHQLCLDATDHLAPRVIHACFDYIVRQDQERSFR